MNDIRALFAVVAALVLFASWACTREVVKEVEVPGETVVVEKEVVKEVKVEVPGETVVVEKEVVKEVEVEVVVEKEVVREVQVPGETVVVEKEVVKEVEVEVVVEKEVIKEVKVPGETVVVEKEVVKEVPVEVVVEKEVVKEVEVEKVVVKEVVKEVPKEVVVEKEVVKIVEVERPGGKEKVLNIRMSSMPPSFPPHTTGSGAVVQVMGYMFPRLAQPDPTLGRWVPDLAERWEVAPDGSKWTFYLRKNAVWNDGMPIIAEDVNASFKSYLHPEAGWWMHNMFESLEGASDVLEGTATEISGVTIIDDHTIQLSMDPPTLTFLDTLNALCGLAPPPVLPAHILKDIPDDQLLEHDFWSSGFMGGGPFKFVEWVPDQYMEMEANDEFYFGRPKIDRLILAVIPSGDATQIAMQRGEIDVTVRGGVTSDAAQTMLLDPRFDVYATQGTVAVGFGFNQRHDHLKDVRLRQAWIYALDRKLLLDKFLNGLGSVINSPLVHSWYQKPEWGDAFPYDPDKSKALLAEMNWDPNQVVMVQAGAPRDEEGRARLAVMQQMLGDVGIKIEYDTEPGASGQNKWYDTHETEVLYSGWGTFGHPTGWLSHINRAIEDGEFYYYNAELHELTNKGAAATDRNEAIMIWQQIVEEYFHKDLPWVGLFNGAGVKVKNKRFYMPHFGEIPKPLELSQIKVYPVHVGRDDNWQYHVEQWDIRD